MSAHLAVITPDGKFSELLDISGLSDGWHSLYAENYDPSGVTYSQECIPLRINNLAPSVSIEGPEYSLEGLGDLFFDASSSDDPIWGREGMHYMWVLRKPSHSGQTPLEIVMGEDKGTMSISTSNSGDYSLTLVVTDAGGATSTMVKEFTIQNVVPEAIASLDGLPIEDGVIDDDDDYSTISVQLVHPDASEPLPYPLIVLMISALFMLSAVLMRYRSSDDSSSIPKWKSDDES